MNGQMFSLTGYVSVVLVLCVPVLWAVHMWRSSRGWLAHVALLVSVAAWSLAVTNSRGHVDRIQVDRSAEINEQMSRQALARKAAEDERAGEVAQIRFAEDASGDFLDKGGLDDSDLTYFESFGEKAPEWKNEIQQQSADGSGDAKDLQAMIGATDEKPGVDVSQVEETAPVEPIFMSDADRQTAIRMDKANLLTSRWMAVFAVLFVAFDYVRRLNRYGESYFPLPLPGSWADSLTPRAAVIIRPDPPRRSLTGELQHIARRGEVFLLLTDSRKIVAEADQKMYRLPGRLWSMQVMNVASIPDADDDFVFETLWYGRNSVIVDHPPRATAMLNRLVVLLGERRALRARTRRHVHVLWDMRAPLAESTRRRFAALGQATGFTLWMCQPDTAKEAA